MASDDSEHYLAVLKASYDYEPKSEDEVAILEDQLLLLIERVDEEWWKVKVKPNSQDSEGSIGLVPAAYVEQANHTSVVKALYDYEATAPGELSVHEDDLLLVFGTDSDWMLVQSSKEQDQAGYVPGNYVEVVDENSQSSSVIVPDSPTLPVSSYVDPAIRVASTKVSGDDIQTWPVSEIDKKGKKKKGTLGIGGGSIFFASEADKTPVQKWQTKDLAAVSSEKSKHVHIDFGGPNALSLHIHTGSKENADSIMEKLMLNKVPVTNDAEETLHENVPPPLDTARESKKASVHFSPASPVIIPNRHEEPEEPEEEIASTDQVVNVIVDGAVALYDFNADGEDELSVVEGDRLNIIEQDGDEWWKCRNARGDEGMVPASYLETQNISKKNEENQLELEREAQRREAAARKAQAQQKAKEASLAAQAERQRRKEAVNARVSPPPVTLPPSHPIEPTTPKPKASTENSRPPPDNTRIWHDRSGQFRVEAAFLGFNNGKLRLHKVNGVIVEVPSEKMSLDDMRYVERLLDKNHRPSSATRNSQDNPDDIPLALSKPYTAPSPKLPPVKKVPKIDWFDFFLSAGCDLDDCTRYAASFERDKIDETLLGDITEGTMRSLGLREGDIIRIKKAIEKRKPTDNLTKPSGHLQEQLRRDEELARELQAQENTPTSKGSAPNLFAGPGGVLKPRRGRPQASKSLPLSNVDIRAISSASDQIQRTNSPQTQPPKVQTPSLTPRPDSAPVSGFGDDAWTNRPSTSKASATPTPQVPPLVSLSQPAGPTQSETSSQSPAPTQSVNTKPLPRSTAGTSISTQPATSTLAKTDSDIFEQLARMTELRKATPIQPLNPQQAQFPPQPTLNIASPTGYNAGIGVGSSLNPMGQHFINQAPQTFNGPRGPFAPVPANQSLLQPLIPTQTGFSGFIPTKPTISTSPFQPQPSPPAFLTQQPTSFPNSPPIVTHPTGVFSNMNSAVSPFQESRELASNPSRFNFISTGQYSSNVPSNNTSPANVFAQMKSGTFATENDNHAVGLPNPTMNSQVTSWGHAHPGYSGY